MRRVLQMIFLFAVAVALLAVLPASLPAGSANACDRTHEGDLIIDGSSTFLIEDETYCQTGNIIVQDNAKLIVRNATLVMNMSFVDQYSILARNSGRLEMENVTVQSSYPVNITAHNRAHVNLNGLSSTYVALWISNNSLAVLERSEIVTLDVREGARAELIDSSVIAFVRLGFDRSFVELSELRPRFYEAWTMDFPMVLNLRRANIGNWAIVVSGSAKVRVEESILQSVGMVFKGVRGTLRNLHPGFYESWELSSQDLDFAMLDLSLRRTTITEGWGIGFDGGCNIEFQDSQVALWGGRWNFITLTRTTVPWFNPANFSGNLQFNESTFSGYMNIHSSSMTWKGSVGFLNTVDLNNFYASTVGREFVVQVVDREGQPVANASVQVSDPEGQAIFSGKTNGQGEATFTITFNDTNYRESWTVALPDYDLEKRIGLLTSTPVKFSISR